MINCKDDEEGEGTLEVSVAESMTESSSIIVPGSLLGDSLANASTQIQSGRAGDSVNDDVASVSTMDTSIVVSRSSENDTELQVDWSTPAQHDPITHMETVEECVELEVDWSENAEEPEETRWSVGMTDALTGVRAEWHWVSTPHPVLTFGNVRAHVKNTFPLIRCSRRKRKVPAVRVAAGSFFSLYSLAWVLHYL